MVKREGETHSIVEYVLAVNLFYAAGNVTYAEDAGLGGIDNGSKAFNAQRRGWYQ